MKAYLIGLALTACAVEPMTSVVESDLCTIEDQEAGACRLSTRTRQTAVNVDPAAAGAPAYCASYSDGRKYCVLNVDLPGHLLVVNCWEVTVGGEVDCTWYFG